MGFTKPVGRALLGAMFLAAAAVPALAQSFNYADFAAPANLQANPSATYPNAGNNLQLTDQTNNIAGSAYHTNLVDITTFRTTFVFQLTSAGTPADGITFLVQNAGLAALGGTGGAMGYAGIATSVAVKFDNYMGANEPSASSTDLITGGGSPSGTGTETDLAALGIDITQGNATQVDMEYDGTNLTVTITDLVNTNTATQVYAVDIPTAVGGNTAYAGFTGATGGSVATQEILSWSWDSPLPPAPTLTALGAVNQIDLSWTAVASATDYTIYRSTTSGGPYTQIGMSGGATTFSDTTAAPLTVYYYVVTATVGGIEGLRSNEASAAATLPPRLTDHDEGLWNDKCSCGSAGVPAAPWFFGALVALLALVRRR